jgi:5-methylcytosine-specific restriction enzyme subunit McrC
MLLYPKHQNNIDENLILGKNDKKIYLKLKSIDLFCDDVSYNEYIEVMKQRVRVL